MNINKESLKTLWYENDKGEKVDFDLDTLDTLDIADDATTQVSCFPLEITTRYLRNVIPEEVKKCKHKRKYIKRTFNLRKGLKGRECMACKGIQVRKTWQLWGRKWEAIGCRNIFTMTTTLSNHSGETAVAMVNSGEYTLSEALLVLANACERCGNALAYKYSDGKEGYAEHSEEWEKCNTRCKFCEGEQDVNN